MGGAGAAVGVVGLVGLKCAAYTQDLSKTHFRLPQLSVGDTDKQTNTHRGRRAIHLRICLSQGTYAAQAQKKEEKEKEEESERGGGRSGFRGSEAGHVRSVQVQQRNVV